MKKLLLVLLIPISNCLVAQVTYVNYFDAIYPYVINQVNNYPFFDVNQDGIGDFGVQTNNSNSISFTSANGQNKLKTSSTSGFASDCTNDTINSVDVWLSQSYVVVNNSAGINIGPHKQGFKLLTKQLKTWKINYHFLYMGKPSFDLLIDDKSIFFKKKWPEYLSKNFL